MKDNLIPIGNEPEIPSCNDNVLLISVDKIKAESEIDENMHDQTIKNAVVYVQDYIIQMVIGTSLFERLKYLITSEWIYQSEFSEYRELLTKYLHPIFIQGVPAYIVIPNSLKSRNAGVYQVSDNNRSASSLNDIKYLQQDYQNKMDFYVQRAIRYLSCNTSCFPELCGCSCEWYMYQFGSKQPTLPINLKKEKPFKLHRGYYPFDTE